MGIKCLEHWTGNHLRSDGRAQATHSQAAYIQIPALLLTSLWSWAIDLISLFQVFCLFVFCFLGPHSQYMEVLRLGSNQSYSCQPQPQPQQCQIRAASTTYTTYILRQRQILNPLSKAVDQIRILMDTGWVLNRSGNFPNSFYSDLLHIYFCSYSIMIPKNINILLQNHSTMATIREFNIDKNTHISSLLYI